MVRLGALILFMLPVGVLVPILEIGPTHVFNPDWPGHARLHEVWQLLANGVLAALAIWLAAARNQSRLASLIGLVLNGSFLVAVLLSPVYGGTMRHSDGTELAVGGINLAVVVMAAGTTGLLALFLTDRGG